MIRIALIAVLALVGCKQANPESCDNPNSPHPDCRDGGPDGPGDCDPACTGGEVCNPSNDMCVECLSPAQCPSQNEPLCDTSINECVGCTSHDQCASNACLPSGACAAEQEVAYVEAGASGNCDRLTPCGLLSAGVATGRAIVKINVTTLPVTQTDKVTLTGPLTIVADPGAKLASTGTAQILEVKDAGTDVAIYDLELVGSALNNDAITLDSGTPKLTLERMIIRGVGGRGVDAQAGEITIRRCVFFDNNAGGAFLDAKFTVTDSIFVANGDAALVSGAARLTPVSGSIFQFNTIADNTSQVATDDGVTCVAPFVGANNIVSNDTLDTDCTFNFSLFQPTAPANGTNNQAGDPLFTSRNPADVATATFYRLMANSPAKDDADPNATLTPDIDGDVRPRGPGPDIGADEAP